MMELRKFEFAFGTREDLMKLIKKLEELQNDDEFPDFLWEFGLSEESE